MSQTSSSRGVELAASVRAIVDRHGGLNPDALKATESLFAPLHAPEPYAGVSVTRDLAYGADVRHKLDLFAPVQAGTARRPVLVYVHGGGFVRGDKRIAGTAFHDNIAVWACRNGMIGVTIIYRLAPQHVWPAGPEDIAAATAWLRGNVASFGGDPNRIVLFGHSAGAAHVAGYVAHPEFHAAPGAGVAGAILGSGIYDLSRSTTDVERMYFGDNPDVCRSRSAIGGLLTTKVPWMAFLAERDPAMFQEQALGLLSGFFERHRRLPRMAFLSGENHFSPVMHLGYEPGDRLGPEICDFVQSECGAVTA